MFRFSLADWLIADHVTLGYIFIKCIPSGIQSGERDQWPGQARDQNVTNYWWRDCGVMFWSSLPGYSRKFAASSSRILETRWNSLRLKPALSTFCSRNEVKKHLQERDYENGWRASQFFPFVYDVFAVHLKCLEYITESCSALLLTIICSFVRLICSSFECITTHIMSVPSGNS